MSHTLAPADASHYYQRLAELSTLPFWQREEFTEPAGPERGHVWRWQDVYPELARSRQFAADAADLQRRALILCNPGLTAPAAGATPTIAAAYQMLICGGQTFALLPNDVAAIPAWTWHQLTASDRELVLLRLTDRPIHDAFGLFQAEEEEEA